MTTGLAKKLSRLVQNLVAQVISGVTKLHQYAPKVDKRFKYYEGS